MYWWMFFVAACTQVGTSPDEKGVSADDTAQTGGEDSAEPAPCESDFGTLFGTVYDDLPWTEGRPPVPNADVVFHTAEDVTPIYGVTNDEGVYEVSLPADRWRVSASAGSCGTMGDIWIDIVACGRIEQELSLTDCWLGEGDTGS